MAGESGEVTLMHWVKLYGPAVALALMLGKPVWNYVQVVDQRLDDLHTDNVQLHDWNVNLQKQVDKQGDYIDSLKEQLARRGVRYSR